jgi:hypothetical protein
MNIHLPRVKKNRFYFNSVFIYNVIYEPVPKPIGVLEQALGENCQFLISQALTAFAIFSLGKKLFQKLKFWNSLIHQCDAHHGVASAGKKL